MANDIVFSWNISPRLRTSMKIVSRVRMQEVLDSWTTKRKEIKDITSKVFEFSCFDYEELHFTYIPLPNDVHQVVGVFPGGQEFLGLLTQQPRRHFLRRE